VQLLQFNLNLVKTLY